jgi:glucose-1-phosphate cytidylyltransferase
VEIHKIRAEPWRVTMLYTGQETQTGGRLLRAKDYIGDERFFLTYGDGVADVDIPALLKSHEASGRLATMTAVRPAGRFGALEIAGDGLVRDFKEKPEGDTDWINGGFFVMESAVFDYLKKGPDSPDPYNDGCVLERRPLERLAAERQLNAYRHEGFWKCMDTLRDRNELAGMWAARRAPWAVWN